MQSADGSFTAVGIKRDDGDGFDGRGSVSKSAKGLARTTQHWRAAKDSKRAKPSSHRNSLAFVQRGFMRAALLLLLKCLGAAFDRSSTAASCFLPSIWSLVKLGWMADFLPTVGSSDEAMQDEWMGMVAALIFPIGPLDMPQVQVNGAAHRAHHRLRGSNRKSALPCREENTLITRGHSPVDKAT